MAPKRRTTGPNGRELGPRALRTRDHLLDVTEALMRERGVLGLSVVDIARRAEMSPGTFYHYFADVEEAALRLAERAADEMPAVVELIDGPWEGPDGLVRARAIVTSFADHWDRHHEVLSVRNLAAERGDARFQKVRRRALAPVLAHFADRIREGQETGRVSRSVHPEVAAAAISAILERLSAHYRALRTVTRADLVETCARMIHQTVTGRATP